MSTSDVRLTIRQLINELDVINKAIGIDTSTTLNRMVVATVLNLTVLSDLLVDQERGRQN